MGELVGGVLNYFGAKQGADAARDAANISAQAQLAAARLAAEEARFRPVGVTTRFGQSNFTTDAAGRVSGAGYTLSPELKAYQDRIMGLTGQGLTEAEAAQGRYAPLTGAASGLFNLGAGYLAQSPEQAAAQYMQRQQDLLAPSRERQYAGLQNQLFQTGRGGLAVGVGTQVGDGLGVGHGGNPLLAAHVFDERAVFPARLAIVFPLGLGERFHECIQAFVHPGPLALVAVHDHREVIVTDLVDDHADEGILRAFGVGAVRLGSGPVEANHRVFHTADGAVNRPSDWVGVIEGVA